MRSAVSRCCRRSGWRRSITSASAPTGAGTATSTSARAGWSGPAAALLPLPLARTLPERPLGRATIDAGAAVSGAASRCQVLTRRIESEVFAHDVPTRAGTVAVDLRPSGRVSALDAAAQAWLAERAPAGYAAVHVRRGDRLFGPMRWLTRPRAVRRALRRLGVADGATVFFLSDEHAPDYWGPLEAAYDAVRATALPALATLVARGATQPPDNFLLYEVEKAIMRRAAVRIETFPGPEYAPAEETLVPGAVWWAARRGRRTVHAALRLARRAAGERAWLALRSARDRARSKA